MFGMADLGKYVRMREVLCEWGCPEGYLPVVSSELPDVELRALRVFYRRVRRSILSLRRVWKAAGLKPGNTMRAVTRDLPEDLPAHRLAAALFWLEEVETDLRALKPVSLAQFDVWRAGGEQDFVKAPRVWVRSVRRMSHETDRGVVARMLLSRSMGAVRGLRPSKLYRPQVGECPLWTQSLGEDPRVGLSFDDPEYFRAVLLGRPLVGDDFFDELRWEPDGSSLLGLYLTSDVAAPSLVDVRGSGYRVSVMPAQDACLDDPFRPAGLPVPPEGFRKQARLLDVPKYGVGQLDVLRVAARGAVAVVGGADLVALSEVLRASEY